MKFMWNEKKLVNLSFERQFLITACHSESQKKVSMSPKKKKAYKRPPPQKWKGPAHWTFIYTVQFYSKTGVLQ